MGIFINDDIEGVAGIVHRNECSKAKPDYKSEIGFISRKDSCIFCDRV
jgi:D-aminopeptidase